MACKYISSQQGGPASELNRRAGKWLTFDGQVESVDTIQVRFGDADGVVPILCIPELNVWPAAPRHAHRHICSRRCDAQPDDGMALW